MLEKKALTPQEIVNELDKHVIGQHRAKRAIAIALRNRWRRQNVVGEIKNEIYPANILMIGPTGVGKTEMSRRTARIANAPFIKVEATKFTEVGYVGRDAESIIRDLVEVGINIVRENWRTKVEDEAKRPAEERILEALVGENASEETREKFRAKLHSGILNETDIELSIAETPPSSGSPLFDIPGMPGGQIGMVNITDVLSRALNGNKMKNVRVKVGEAYKILIREESDKLIDEDKIIREAIELVENNGIVFLDEIDKICSRSPEQGGGRAEVSREGVQRDLLPLIEGCTVTTKYGTIKTDHVLFIASGAFHLAKPSDLLPELQGRLPIRVELAPLEEDDLARILREPQHSLLKQYTALFAVEGVTLEFTESGIKAIAATAAEINREVENIGARRLHTILGQLLEVLNFTASEIPPGETVVIDDEYVSTHLAEIHRNTDLSRFIL